MMFMRHLSKVLDKNDPDWRSNTIITMDGAKYHLSSECMELYGALNLQIMFNPPHGYNVAPVELVFAALKNKHLNED